MDYAEPLCQFCQNRFTDDPFACSAFPDGIPEPITHNEADHRLPYRGDGGTRFESGGFLTDAEILGRFGKPGSLTVKAPWYLRLIRVAPR